MTFQFKIQINNITNPPVWRRITIPSRFTFLEFHYAIQVAFGWTNAHLFQFSPKGYGSWPCIKEIFEDDDDLSFGDRGETLDAEKTKLSEIFFTEGQKYIYIYDFGDDWKHTVTLEKIVSEKTLYPYCLGGKGQCPPEDCGGPWAYNEEIKYILMDKKHPQHKEYKEWCFYEGQKKWDPEEFNLEETQTYMTEFFSENHFPG
jgi:hypothetical protein